MTDCDHRVQECHDGHHSHGLPIAGGVGEQIRAVLPEHDRQVRRQVAEEIAQAIEVARDKLHSAFSEGDGNLPRGHSNAARIAREVGGTDDR